MGGMAFILHFQAFVNRFFLQKAPEGSRSPLERIVFHSR